MVGIEQMAFVTSSELEEHRFSMFLIATLSIGFLLLMTLMAITRFSIRTYFILVFISLLITSEIFAPVDAKTAWWRRVQIVKVVGWIIFGYIIFERISPFL